MSSWVKENCLTFFQTFCIRVIKTGRVPQHIAFIMDGNRRFAKKHNVDKKTGHSRGFDKLSETLRWCLDLGIPEVTVYAFSIENFKRSKQEVDALMDLAREKFQDLIDQIDQISDWGVRIHVAGRLSLLPSDLRQKLAQVMLESKNNSRLRLNIAYAYTGRDEISRAASYIVDGVNNKELKPEDIDQELVSATLELTDPELLIRTSGEVRLSDFMLWQISNTVLYFTDVLWPDFTIYNLLAAIIHFQKFAPKLKPDVELSDRILSFLEKLKMRRENELQSYVLNC